MTELSLANVIINFISNGMVAIFNIICWHSCMQTKLKVNLKKNIFLTFGITLFITTFIFIFPNPLRLIIVFLSLILVCYIFIIKNLKQSLLLVICSQLTIWIAENSFMILTSLFKLQNIESITSIPRIYFLLNMCVTLISFIMLKLKLPQKLYKLLIDTTKSVKDNETLIYSFIIIAIIVISMIENYMHLPSSVIIITNVTMGIIFIGIIFMSSKIKANYNKISSKYETSISSLKEYEVMIDKFRVYTHENKNEFYTIRNMLKNAEDRNEVIKYIDTLIDNKIQDNEKIMAKTAKIPSGGLRATIYSKLCLMDKLKIKYKLNISRDVRTTDLIDLDEDLVLKICKILGVFLDNAIEAVKGLKKKQIAVEMYAIDNDLCIDITNNFKGNLDINKISEAKYTTKGDGHGYGLTLVNQIINDEAGKLENEKSINRDTFTQTLKIKM